ncbi:MAG: hypothetical protein MUE56_07890 [Ignavibacteria bacterium]|nr:hypothetical protein [Ignavibacteria bacterium]
MGRVVIQYCGKHIRILEVSEKKTVKYIDQFDYLDSAIFFLEPKLNHKRISELSELLISGMRKNSVYTDTIEFILDTRLAYISVIPVDFSDEIDNTNSTLIWELSNFFPESYKNFKITYQKLQNGAENAETFGNTLLVAYHKQIAEITRRLSELTSIKFSKINFDVFAAGLYFQNSGVRDFICIGCKNDKTDISFYKENKIRYFTSLYLKEKPSGYYYEEINGILNLPEFSGISSIFVYGEEAAISIFGKLDESMPKRRVLMPDPFSDVTFDNPYDKLKNLHSFSFIPLFGIVL